VLLWHPDGFIIICWTLRSVRTPSKARSDGCTGIDCFCLGFCKDSSWTSLSSLWSVIVFDLIIVWIHEDSKLKTDHPVKTQPLHKVFLFYSECSQYKILTLSSLWSVIVFDLIIVWIHEDSELKTDHPVKTQPLHKVFLFYPECSQYKILTNSPIGHSGTKALDRFGNTFLVKKTKKCSPFLSHNDKG